MKRVAITLVTTRNLTGSSPIVVRGVHLLVHLHGTQLGLEGRNVRPAITMAVIRGPSSASIAQSDRQQRSRPELAHRYSRLKSHDQTYKETHESNNGKGINTGSFSYQKCILPPDHSGIPGSKEKGGATSSPRKAICERMLSQTRM